MDTYTFGTCPEHVIKTAVKEQCPDGYPMGNISQEDWTPIANAVNQGIDSHLEAITTRSKFNPNERKCNIHPEELHVLLRRLFEDGSEEAWDLRSSILFTLDIEEV